MTQMEKVLEADRNPSKQELVIEQKAVLEANMEIQQEREAAPAAHHRERVQNAVIAPPVAVVSIPIGERPVRERSRLTTDDYLQGRV